MAKGGKKLVDNDFLGYRLRFSGEEDFESIISIIEAREIKLSDSKRIAVYNRDRALVQDAARDGRVVILERSIVSDYQNEQRIIGITAVYPLGEDQCANRKRLTLQKDGIPRWAAEVGSTRYLVEKDLPNHAGRLPSYVFFVPMVSFAVARAFELAAEEVGCGAIDSIVANVQNRHELTDTRSRIQADPLGFTLIRPTDELANAVGDTIQGDVYATMGKSHYLFPLYKVPCIANYILRVMGYAKPKNQQTEHLDGNRILYRGQISSGVGGSQSRAFVDVVVHDLFVRVMQEVLNRPDLFSNINTPDSSLAEARLQVRKSMCRSAPNGRNTLPNTRQSIVHPLRESIGRPSVQEFATFAPVS